MVFQWGSVVLQSGWHSSVLSVPQRPAKPWPLWQRKTFQWNSYVWWSTSIKLKKGNWERDAFSTRHLSHRTFSWNHSGLEVEKGWNRFSSWAVPAGLLSFPTATLAFGEAGRREREMEGGGLRTSFSQCRLKTALFLMTKERTHSCLSEITMTAINEANAHRQS